MLRQDDTSRRALLSKIGGLSTIAMGGCLGDTPTEQATTNRAQATDRASDTTHSSGESWPQFGANPGNTGYTQRVSGPGAQSMQLAWRYDAGTPTMNSSPVVGDRTVYVPGSGDPGLIHAIDLDSGDQRWEFEPAGYASSAPALVDGTLYVGTWGKRFYAIDAESGDEEWSREIGHRFGSSSPAVVDGTIYVGTVGDGPLVVSGPDDQAAFEACALLALDATSGEIRWRYDRFDEKDNIHSSPAVADGLVFFAAEGSLYALDSESGEDVWTRTVPTHRDASPAVWDDVVYVGSRTSENAESPRSVWAFDIASGETRWTAGIDDQTLRTSPAVADGAVYVAASSRRWCFGDGTDEDSTCQGVTRGQLYALDAASGDRRWTADIEADTRSSPAIAGETIYVGCDDGLSAVTTDGKTTGRVRFEPSDETHYVDSSPAVADGYVCVGASDGRLRAVRGPT